MKLSDIPNLLPHTTVSPEENPVSKLIRKKRTKTFKRDLRLMLRNNRKHGNPRDPENPITKGGCNGEDEGIDRSPL